MIKNFIDGFVPVDTATISEYNAAKDYFAVTVKGNCLNHDDCPIRIKDGDLLLCESIDRFDFFRNWQAYRDKIVLVVPCLPNSLHINYSLVKQFVGVVHGWFFIMQMFNPPMEIELPIDEIKEISIVKTVLQG